MTPSLLQKLRNVDTPTVCNAIEVAQGQRGFNDFTRGTLLASDPSAAAMVGYACTAQLAARQPPDEDPAVIRSRRMDYYRYMAQGRRPAVTVIEDLDYPDAIGAYWGEINTVVHKGFGIAGALTNGVVRDLGSLADNFPVLAGSIGPSHGFVHIKDIDCELNVFGLTVKPGDLIHADRHGALVIPPAVLPVLEAAIEKLIANENLVLEPARREDFDYAAFEQAWQAFERARV